MLSRHTLRKILLMLICFFLSKFVKQDNLILISSKHGYVGNAAAFANQFQQRAPEDYELIWMGNQRHRPSSIRSSAGRGLMEEARLLCRASYALYTHTPGDVSLFLPRQIIRINLWHGNPIKYILDDTPKKKSAYKKRKLAWLNQDPKASDYFFSGGPRFDQIMCSCTGFPKDRILSEGLPRNEVFYQAIGNALAEPGFCLYAPTFRDKMTQEDRIEALCRKWQGAFQDLALKLVVKLHPNDRTNLDFTRQFNWVEIADNKEDINRLAMESSMLITDYSSLAFDYMILKKPVYLLMDDIANYQIQRGGTYVSPEELAQIFDCVETVDLLVERILRSHSVIFDDTEEEYNRRFDMDRFLTQCLPALRPGQTAD